MRTHCSIVVNCTLTSHMAIVFLCVSTNPTVDTLHSIKAVLWITFSSDAQEYVVWIVKSF